MKKIINKLVKDVIIPSTLGLIMASNALTLTSLFTSEISKYSNNNSIVPYKESSKLIDQDNDGKFDLKATIVPYAGIVYEKIN